MADIHLKEPEHAHALLYKAHWDLVRASDHLHAVVMQVTEAARHRETRERLAPLISGLQGVQDKIEEARRTAGNIRSDLIALTGCDRRCEIAAESPGPSKAPAINTGD